jgi:pimeloyl-ACP methyl ester carboxylesterase
MPMLKVNGVRLYFNVKGEGIPIVFIHPPLLTSDTFHYQSIELSHRFKVITFDIRGHGRSQYSQTPITYQQIVEDIKMILDHLKIEKAFLCGYSTGGSIVLEFLLTAANRALGGIVISGMSEVSDQHLKNKISLGLKLSKAGAIPVLAFSVSWSNSDSTRLFKKLFTMAKQGNARNIEQYYFYSLHYNCTEQLGNINLPVLLVFGSKDKTFHRYAKILHDKLPSNELIFIKKVNHRIPSKTKMELNQRISYFVNSHH